MATAAPVAARVPAPITHLVPVEVIEGLVSMLREWTAIAVMWIKAVIYVAVEASRAMKPRAGSNKDTAGEPLRPIVSIGGAAVRRIVEVAIWASRRYSNIDGDPCRCSSWETKRSGGQYNEYR
jgi:hypothetical protein